MLKGKYLEDGAIYIPRYPLVSTSSCGDISNLNKGPAEYYVG